LKLFDISSCNIKWTYKNVVKMIRSEPKETTTAKVAWMQGGWRLLIRGNVIPTRTTTLKSTGLSRKSIRSTKREKINFTWDEGPLYKCGILDSRSEMVTMFQYI